MEHKTSAVSDEPVQVLFVLQNKFDLLDFAGPLEVLAQARADKKDDASRAFDCTIAGAESKILSDQGVVIDSQISFKEAHGRLNEFDVLVVVGGDSDHVLKSKSEPMPIITAFAELQKNNPTRERTLLSVCTGSLFLAELGILSGLSATTHPDYMTAFENLCSHSAVRDLQERTDVMEDARYVVNNLRFDIGDEDENPYIRRKSDAGRRPSNARKGSMSFKESNTRRESITRRAAMRLGGLRVITAGGVSAGIDAALYLVSIVVDEEVAEEVAGMLQHTWTKGVVVDGLDVPDHMITFLRPKDKQPPNFATFKVPRTFNKMDLRDYLLHAYEVATLGVRSQLRQQRPRRSKVHGRIYRPPPIKTMTVELAKPFVWPARPEDKTPWTSEREERQDAATRRQRSWQSKIQKTGKMPLREETKAQASRATLREQAKRLLEQGGWESGTAVDPRFVQPKKDDGVD
ncbi:hypothetical protein DL770_007021 [Monosporascus sp. CRB-9-2]|nr:hypothetical protein DL770_007021 [Monosporascus sp. CRB-9-2]